jgi:hypothetical protein
MERILALYSAEEAAYAPQGLRISGGEGTLLAKTTEKKPCCAGN